MPHLSLRGYAAHRRDKGLPGGNLNAVQKAIARGAIQTDADGRIDPAKADAAWVTITPTRASAPDAAQTNRAASATHADVDDDGEAIGARQLGAGAAAAQTVGLAYQRARTAREVTRARIEGVKLDRLTGKNVDRAAVEESWERQVTMARTRLLGLPAKFKGRLPHLTTSDLAMMQEEIENVLRDLANVQRTDDADD